MKIRKNMKYIVKDSFHSLYEKVGTCVSLKKNIKNQSPIIATNRNTVVLEFPNGMKYEFTPDQLVPLLKRVK